MKLYLDQKQLENIIKNYCENNKEMPQVVGNIYLNEKTNYGYYGDKSYKYTASYETRVTIDGKTYHAEEELNETDLKRIIKEYFARKGYNATSVTFDYDDGDMRGPSSVNAEVNIKTKVRERNEKNEREDL